MKLKFKIASFLGALLFTLCLSVNSFAGWDYYASSRVDNMDGRTYIVMDCEDKLGDDCNMIGSAIRTDVTDVLTIFGYGLMRIK